MTLPYRFVAEQNNDRQRLDRFLASLLGGISRMRIARLISEGYCMVNGVAKDSGYKMSTGDIVSLGLADLGPTSMTPERIPIVIVFEDPHIAVVVKPSGMLVHPTLGVKSGTLSNALSYHFHKEILGTNGILGLADGRSECGAPSRHVSNDGAVAILVSQDDQTCGRSTGIQAVSANKNLAAPSPLTAPAGTSSLDRDPLLELIRPGIVHRLDRATSGLLVVAKTPHALSVLTKHFRKAKVKKRYLALVQGKVEGDCGSISAPIGRDPERRPHWWIMESGRASETNWKVIGRGDGWSMLELEPLTGRTNQLRIHCAYWGHPILGDELYAQSWCDPDKSHSLPPLPLPGRLLLHAWQLAFHHPETGVWSEFTAPPPSEMASYPRLAPYLLG
jgi:23S rRNA-/tRNA-specific pseudouridylate synthase